MAQAVNFMEDLKQAIEQYANTCTERANGQNNNIQGLADKLIAEKEQLEREKKELKEQILKKNLEMIRFKEVNDLGEKQNEAKIAALQQELTNVTELLNQCTQNNAAVQQQLQDLTQYVRTKENEMTTIFDRGDKIARQALGKRKPFKFKQGRDLGIQLYNERDPAGAQRGGIKRRGNKIRTRYVMN